MVKKSLSYENVDGNISAFMEDLTTLPKTMFRLRMKSLSTYICRYVFRKQYNKNMGTFWYTQSFGKRWKMKSIVHWKKYVGTYVRTVNSKSLLFYDHTYKYQSPHICKARLHFFIHHVTTIFHQLLLPNINQPAIKTYISSHSYGFFLLYKLRYLQHREERGDSDTR